MLGVNSSNVKWTQILANFIIIFLAQLVFCLYNLSVSGVFPTQFEIYEAVLTSLIASFAFYGINKATVEKKEE